MSITDLTPQQLRRAADIQEQISELHSELNQILIGSTYVTGPEPSDGRKKRRKLSAEGLANIRAGARKRWAAKHSEQETNGMSLKPRRRMSAAGKAAIAAAARERWARWRAARR
jgi:hypothetical protein